MKRRGRRTYVPYNKLLAAHLFKSATGGFVPLNLTLHGIHRPRTTSGQGCEGACSREAGRATSEPVAARSAHTTWESRRSCAVYAATSGCSPQRNSERPSAASAHARMDCIPGVAADSICAEAARGVFGDFMMQSVKGQIATQMEAVTGIPSGLWTAFSGGGTFKQCMGNYLEGLAWQNFETATGLEGFSSLFQAQMKKAEANKKRHEAGRFKPEDMQPLGALTYTWRNAEYRPGLKRTLGVAETVVFTTLEAASTIIPGIGNAGAAGVIAGYYAAKQAYVGSLHGGTRGAAAGLVSGAVTGGLAAVAPKAISPSIDVTFDYETGWSGSAGLQVGEGLKVGGSVTMHEGHGMTGFSANAGIPVAGAASIGANASFDGTGKYQGSQIALNVQNKSGRTFTGGVNFGKAGYSGVTLGTSHGSQNGNEKLTSSQSITLNKDGSTDVSASVNASVVDGGRAGLNQFGAGASTTAHIDKKGATTLTQKLNTQLGFQTRAQAFKNIEESWKTGRATQQRKAQQQSDSDQNKRKQNETKDVFAGSARRKEEEEAGQVDSPSPSQKGFLDTIGDAIAGGYQTIKNGLMYGSFSTDAEMLAAIGKKTGAEVVEKVLRGERRPGVLLSQVAENMEALTPGERAFLENQPARGTANVALLKTSLNPETPSDQGAAPSEFNLDQATARARARVGLMNTAMEGAIFTGNTADERAAEAGRVTSGIIDTLIALKGANGTFDDADILYATQQYGVPYEAQFTEQQIGGRINVLVQDQRAREESARQAAQKTVVEPYAAQMALGGRSLFGGFSIGTEPFPTGIGIRNTPADDLASSNDAIRRGRLYGAGMRMAESVLEIGGGIAATASGFQKLSSSRLALGSVAVVQGIADFDNATREWQNAWSGNPRVVESGYVEAYKDLAGTNAPPGWLYVADSVPRNLAMGQALIGIGGATGVTLSAGDVYGPGVYAGVGNALGAYTADRDISTADVMRSYDQGSTFGMLGGWAGAARSAVARATVVPAVAALGDVTNQKSGGATNIDTRRVLMVGGIAGYGQSVNNYVGGLYRGPGNLPYLMGGFSGDALTVGPSFWLSSYGATIDSHWVRK